MKPNILSDLHLGFGAMDRPVNDADVVVLAGDISRSREAVAWTPRFDKPVLYAPGNHDFYGSSIDGAADEFERPCTGCVSRAGPCGPTSRCSTTRNGAWRPRTKPAGGCATLAASRHARARPSSSPRTTRPRCSGAMPRGSRAGWPAADPALVHALRTLWPEIVLESFAARYGLDGWLNQRFLGARVTYGEDRALTNDILRLGYDSVYQRAASVLTVVPTTYRKLCMMFLRWERSFVREEMRFACIVWRRPLRARLFALLDMATTNLRSPALYASLLILGFTVWDDPLVLPRMALAMGAVSLLYSLYYLRSERSLDVVYGVAFGYFSFFCLSWIPAYAVSTVRARGWLTR